MNDAQSLQQAIEEPVQLVEYDSTWPARYAALKRELASRHCTDREAYTQAKGEFVRFVIAQ